MSDYTSSKKKRLMKQYKNLGVGERARLMVQARVGGDETDFETLRLSAPVKHYSIGAFDENNIVKVICVLEHKFVILMLEAQLRISRLSSAMVDANEDGFEEKVEQFREAIHATMDLIVGYQRGFESFMDLHKLPIDWDFLSGLGADRRDLAERRRPEPSEVEKYRDIFNELFEANADPSILAV